MITLNELQDYSNWITRSQQLQIKFNTSDTRNTDLSNPNFIWL